jgi:dipeptidyl-peptidase-3
MNPSEKPNYIDKDAPVRGLDCETAFSKLDSKEQNYAYYFSRASWEGQKICYFSKSYESPALFYLISKIFSQQTIEEVKASALQNGLDGDDWAKLTA